MGIYQWLCLLGIPSIIACMFGWLVSKVREIQALKLGLQALLRSQMIHDYNYWTKKGYAPIYAKENFENVWKQYHSLGANGVMDNIHEEFMELPTNPTQPTNI